MGTAKGYTGQYADPLTGFDYYNARYYDPVAGVFLSADSVQGNASGMNPYAYVGGNPETKNDPTGKYYSTAVSISNGGSVGYVTSSTITTVSNNGHAGFYWVDDSYYSSHNGSMEVSTFTRQQEARYGSYNPDTDPNNSPAAKIARVIGLPDLQQTWNDPTATGWDKTLALGRFIGTNLNNIAQLGMIFGGPEGEEGAALEEGATAAEEEAGTALEKVASECGGLSFTPTTPVTTDHGKQAIGTMHVGEKVLAYNPTTHKMELEPVLHVWINHDNDLVDLTLTTATHAPHSTVVSTKSEVIHTNKKHPFLTKEKGFLSVAHITLGMHILRADGTYGVVTGWHIVPGVKAMYNLEVAQDHTFTVGAGQWVVHNASCSVKNLDPLHSPETSGSRPDLEKLSDQELLDSVNNPKNGDPIRINPNTGKVVDGNGRAYELLRRSTLPGSGITPDTPIHYEPYIPSSIPDPGDEPPDLWDLLNGR